jgi:abortive infection bacteriophage resistance protein
MNLRNIMVKYISRIEIAIRSNITYNLSTKYKDNPYWFVDANVVSTEFISNFDLKAYNSIKKKLPIKRHHAKYTGKYAPAWKTIEYMTLGNLEMLYSSLKKDKDKSSISTYFGEPAIATFKSYLTAIREVRNACAHSNVLFGLTLTCGIRKGVACASFEGNSQQSFNGALRVIEYLLSKISIESAADMRKELNAAISSLSTDCPSIIDKIELLTGIKTLK